MTNEEAIYRNDLERFFGNNFSISYTELYDFINYEKKRGISEFTIITASLKMFRDDLIDFHSLTVVLDYVYFDLPKYFEQYADNAKLLIRSIAPTVNSAHELIARLLSDYQNNKFNLYMLNTSALMMGSIISPEFFELSEEQRKNTIWYIDRNGNVLTLEKGKLEYIKCIDGILNIDNSDIFIPSRVHNKPFDFVYDYMDSLNISDDVLKESGLDRRYKYRISRQDQISKMDVFRLIFILKMPTQVAKEFMTVCGYSFSPINKTDLFFLDYLNGKYKKAETLEELTKLAKNYCNVNFEWNQWA